MVARITQQVRPLSLECSTDRRHHADEGRNRARPADLRLRRNRDRQMDRLMASIALADIEQLILALREPSIIGAALGYETDLRNVRLGW